MYYSNLSQETFVQYFGALYEQSWVVERAYHKGLAFEHDDPDELLYQFGQICYAATHGEKLTLLRSYPDLAGKAAGHGCISRESMLEQHQAGLDRCSPQQFSRFNNLNRLYWGRFGFPFIAFLNERTPDEVLGEFSERLCATRDVEFMSALAEVQKIARCRLRTLVLHDRQQQPDQIQAGKGRRHWFAV